MPGAFVPPHGLVEGTGSWAYVPASERQRIYNQLYRDYLAGLPPADVTLGDYEIGPGGEYVRKQSGTRWIVGPGGEWIENPNWKDPNAGRATVGTYTWDDLPTADQALLDTYNPGWRLTPTYYRTPTQLAALIAQAKRKQSQIETGVGKKGVGPTAASSGQKAYELGSGYRLYFDPVDDTWSVRKDVYTGDSVNGVPVGSNFTLTTVSAAQAQGLIALLGGERNAWRDYHLQGWSQGHGGGQQGTGPLTEAQIQAAIALPPTTTTPPPGSGANPLTAPVAPHLMASLANPPTKAGESTPEMLASRAAQDTVREIAAEMAARQRTSEEATLLGSPMLTGYKPIRLRPRT